MSRRGSKLTPLVVLVAVVSLAACSAAGPDAGSDDPAPIQTASEGRLSLAGVCPSTIVVQTGWYPEVERAAVYALVGPKPRIDAKKKRVTGTLVAEGQDTGVRVEVRAGGPAIGFQPVSAQMYADQAITLGEVSTDESVRYSLSQPTLSVVAPLDVDPLAVIWDPQTYPSFSTVTDIGLTDTTVLYFAGSTPMDYLVGSGILKRSQADGSYDGSPSRFVAAGGKIAQMGFATNEPYLLEHEVGAWGKPVASQLVYDTGYPIYPRTTLAIRASQKRQLTRCLKKLVPIIQRAQTEFMADPKPTVDLILRLVDAYGGGFVYSRGLADYGVEQLTTLGLAGNGSRRSDRTLGDFDASRVQKTIDIVVPIFTGQRKPVKPNLTPADIATNDFIDPAIGLPERQ